MMVFIEYFIRIVDIDNDGRIVFVSVPIEQSFIQAPEDNLVDLHANHQNTF